MSLGLAYRYFADEEAIFSELVRQTVSNSSAGFQELVEMPEQFRTFVPDAQIVLRLFQPSTDEKNVSEQS